MRPNFLSSGSHRPPGQRLGVPTHYSHRTSDGQVQCDLCPRDCRLRDGQRGACSVRTCVGDRIVLTTHGWTSGFAVDPIERQALHHFLPGTPTLVLGTAGCNLTCLYCAQWGVSRAREDELLWAEAPPAAIAAAAARLGCRSVTFAGNDPVVYQEFAVDVAHACHERGIRTVAVTAGYVHPEPREEFFHHVDAVCLELKAFSEGFYHRMCGGHLQPVLDTLLFLRRHTQVWVEIALRIVPGENDSPAEVSALSDWIANELGVDTPLHVQPFRPVHLLRDHKPTPATTLHLAQQIARASGLRYVYADVDGEDQTTDCVACGQWVIDRRDGVIKGWHLDDTGRCFACAARCAGVFDARPGRWLAGDVPVDIAEIVRGPRPAPPRSQPPA